MASGPVYDAVVVGARCGGAPLAMLLARAGHRVALVDRASFPSDTMSTHFLWQRGAARLQAWGLLGRLRARGCAPIRQITFDPGPVQISGIGPAVEGAADTYCPRRTVLDALLVEAAAESGADLIEHFVVGDVIWSDGRAAGVRGRYPGSAGSSLRAAVVVGADGMHSGIARRVGARAYQEHPPLTAVYYSYWSGIRGLGASFHARPGQLILTWPTNDDLTCIYVAWPRPDFHRVRRDIEGRFHTALELIPWLREAVAAGHREARFTGTADLPSFYRASAGPGWALAGDAGHHKDPCTGMGMSDAFLAADLLADAIHQGLSGNQPMGRALASYQQRRDAMTANGFELTLSTARLAPLSPRLEALYRTAADQPEVARHVFGILGGSIPLTDLHAQARLLPASLRRWRPVISRPFPIRWFGPLLLVAAGGCRVGWARARGEALMGQFGAQAGGDVLHRGGWVERPVRLYRDEWGIPHVRARSVHDAFVGQGYVHAMDRLWQMDAARKQMEGRWAEWVGVAGLPADRLARRLRVGAASIRDYRALGADARVMVDAYTAGVNAYLRSHPAPAEYGLVASAPEPWEGWHCIAAMRQRGYLMGSVWFKLWRAAALGVLSADDLVKLRYDDGGADRLCIPPGADASRWVASLADLREPIGALSLLAASAETGGGSNNWALAPSRTATGRPILAGDPHRAFELPGMYAQMHLGCDQFDAIGLTIPGVPAFPHFAHNAQVAWCVTHAFADIHDLYVEQFDRADPSWYLHKGDWLRAATTTEDVKVRGGNSDPVQIVETIHGPVVAGDPAHGTALTLKSVQFFDLDRSFDCLLPMLAATSVDSLFQAVRGWGLIDHNLVAADTGGRIGHLVRAVIPRRAAINGWLPVPGWTGEYEWDGVIPAEQMPRADDPARGFIVTANNRVVTAIPDTGDYFCTDAHPPYRARRIEQLIAELAPASPQDMATIHRDDVSEPARLFQAALADVAPPSAAARAVRDIVLGWDARMSPGSSGAACYSRLRWALARIVAGRSGLAAAGSAGLMQLPGSVSAVSHLWWVLPALLRSGDLALTRGSTWDELLAEALEEVSGEPPDIPWRQLHSAALTIR